MRRTDGNQYADPAHVKIPVIMGNIVTCLRPERLCFAANIPEGSDCQCFMNIIGDPGDRLPLMTVTNGANKNIDCAIGRVGNGITGLFNIKRIF